MLISTGLAAVGLALLYFGGDWLVRGASALASGIGISPLAVGLTVVAFGTSAPELIVSVDAALSGASDISVGNVVGSNIANIALILGLAAVLHPVTSHAKLVRVDAPVMLVASSALVALLFDGHASRVEGSLLLLCVVAYTLFTFWEARRESAGVKEELASAVPKAPARGPQGLALVGIGFVGLVVGGHLLVTAAVDLASQLGISEAVIGLTIVAVGTSLPELATSVVASLRGQGDIAIGNIVGSNIFNIFGILGATSVIRPLDMGGVAWLDVGVMIALAAVLATLLAIRPRLGRVEGGLLMVSYLGYTSWLLAG